MHQRRDPAPRVSGDGKPPSEPSYALEQYLSTDADVVERLLEDDIDIDGCAARCSKLKDELEKLAETISGR
ncbi:hypothetical protein B0H67DRAFT_649924 [Lasiosphaeris hirsuta]|uniref:Uncharacterized protein n=1 Tax=Lasiosphaeris hirsuta TaxID=260670 RepID=A0AA39ZXS8_9PEZI|nr:hypothetical protein B0H67DRAFT_649924 [Lasiosphaeris hirsuta]